MGLPVPGLVSGMWPLVVSVRDLLNTTRLLLKPSLRRLCVEWLGMVNSMEKLLFMSRWMWLRSSALSLETFGR